MGFPVEILTPRLVHTHIYIYMVKEGDHICNRGIEREEKRESGGREGRGRGRDQ
jgi:hypothetical protein